MLLANPFEESTPAEILEYACWAYNELQITQSFKDMKKEEELLQEGRSARVCLSSGDIDLFKETIAETSQKLKESRAECCALAQSREEEQARYGARLKEDAKTIEVLDKQLQASNLRLSRLQSKYDELNKSYLDVKWKCDEQGVSVRNQKDQIKQGITDGLKDARDLAAAFQKENERLKKANEKLLSKNMAFERQLETAKRMSCVSSEGGSSDQGQDIAILTEKLKRTNLENKEYRKELLAITQASSSRSGNSASRIADLNAEVQSLRAKLEGKKDENNRLKIQHNENLKTIEDLMIQLRCQDGALAHYASLFDQDIELLYETFARMRNSWQVFKDTGNVHGLLARQFFLFELDASIVAIRPKQPADAHLVWENFNKNTESELFIHFKEVFQLNDKSVTEGLALKKEISGVLEKRIPAYVFRRFEPMTQMHDPKFVINFDSDSD